MQSEVLNVINDLKLDMTASSVDDVTIITRAQLEALEAALSAAESVSSRNDEAGYVEFLNEDVPYVVRDIQGAVAILMDLETRNVIGYRVYDPDSVFAPPAPSVAVKLEKLPAAFEVLDTENGTYLTRSEEAAIASDYEYNSLYRRDGSALSAQVQDAPVKSFIVDYVFDGEVETKNFAYESEQQEAEAFCKEVKAKGGSVNIRIGDAPAAPAKQEG